MACWFHVEDGDWPAMQAEANAIGDAIDQAIAPWMMREGSNALPVVLAALRTCARAFAAASHASQDSSAHVDDHLAKLGEGFSEMVTEALGMLQKQFPQPLDPNTFDNKVH